jgi:uncharacterized protein YbbC (DUF1343 family)
MQTKPNSYLYRYALRLGILLFLLLSFPGKTPAFKLVPESGKNKQDRVKLGIDVLLEKKIGILQGKKIGLITNHTGCNSKLLSTIDLLHKHPEVNLTALFAPEHGLRGMTEAGESISSYRDKYTGLPVHSLYGRTKRPTDEMLRGLDALVFDIQDIGVRWYTYISTLAIAMESAGKKGIEFIVLDRPNPLGGLKIEGPILDKHQKSFVGFYPIPVVYGMTVGELAKFYKGEFNLPVNLKIIQMEGWNRSMVWDDTGLSWIPTSPWIPTSESAMVYPGIGLIGETGLISIGIGYTTPFQIAGAPWISSYALAEKMNEKNLPGAIFRPSSFEPFWGKFHGEKCEGVHVHIVDKSAFMPLSTALHLLEAIRNLYPQRFASVFNRKRRKSFDRYLGVTTVSEALKKGEKIEPIINTWEEEIEKFREKRKKYLLY